MHLECLEPTKHSVKVAVSYSLDTETESTLTHQLLEEQVN
jgi:hypothetical protein